MSMWQRLGLDGLWTRCTGLPGRFSSRTGSASRQSRASKHSSTHNGHRRLCAWVNPLGLLGVQSGWRRRLQSRGRLQPSILSRATLTSPESATLSQAGGRWVPRSLSRATQSGPDGDGPGLRLLMNSPFSAHGGGVPSFDPLRAEDDRTDEALRTLVKRPVQHSASRTHVHSW